MLVLSCKLGERIVLPGIDTTVSVIAIRGKVARLGISAPGEITVHRAEVRKQEESMTMSGRRKDEG